MAGKEPDTGPTSNTVAANVTKFRGDLGMNYTDLSEQLGKAAGWSINAVGIRRTEKGERRVTPDDLIALALALGVSPITLLMPATSDPADEVEVTGADKVTADRLWAWLLALYPLTYQGEPNAMLGQIFQSKARPEWMPVNPAVHFSGLPADVDMDDVNKIAQNAAAAAIQDFLKRDRQSGPADGHD